MVPVISISKYVAQYLGETNQRNRVGCCGLDSSGPGQGPVADCCEHGNELLASIKDGE